MRIFVITVQVVEQLSQKGYHKKVSLESLWQCCQSPMKLLTYGNLHMKNMTPYPLSFFPLRLP
jgi:hypothetical protein